MINLRIIAKALGGLILLEAFLMGICLGVSLLYCEGLWLRWLIPIAITIVVGAILFLFGRNAQRNFGRRDGYLVVSSTWIIFSLFGMLPFLSTECTDRVSIAFFETMSGFSTTGASAFEDIDALPHSILFWRSLTHWIGGMGIIFFTLAVLPALGIGEQKLFAAEATGIRIGKLHPKISTTAHWLWSLYFLLTGSCITAYYFCGMNIFDAINHGLSTIATGGFSTHTDSIGYFHSPLIEYVSVLFMWLASCNFTLLYLLLIKRRFKQVFHDNELRFYLWLTFGSVVVITIALFFTHSSGASLSLHEHALVGWKGFEESFRAALFNVVSLQTTTGFTNDDFMLWPKICWLTITIISVIGACSGSTSGGVKVVRIVIALKLIWSEFKQILHPRAVLPVRLNDSVIERPVIHAVIAYTFLYIILVVGGTGIMILLHLPVLDAMGLAISSFSNIGPTVGHDIGPLTSWGGLSAPILWLNSFLMLAGRLEVFSLLLPLVPAFWRDH